MKSTRNALLALLLLALLAGIYFFKKSRELPLVEIRGSLDGKAYRIRYLGAGNYRQGIDSLLREYSAALYNGRPDSDISQLNANTLHKYTGPFFYPALKQSARLYGETDGAFNPAASPLKKACASYLAAGGAPQSFDGSNLLPLVQFDSIYFDSVSVCKLKEGMVFDFSETYAAFALDAVAGFLRKKGINDYLVEAGGAICAQGVNENGDGWTVAITEPAAVNGKENKNQAFTLKNRAMAALGDLSGTRSAGETVALNLSTGKVQIHRQLGICVFADDAFSAAAYASAFMSRGPVFTRYNLDQHSELDAWVLYRDNNGRLSVYMTEGLRKHMAGALQ